MDMLIDFLEDNVFFAVLIIAGFILLVVMLLIFFKRSKKRSKKIEKIEVDPKFDKSFQQFEKTYFKKCRKCGGNVPIGDNICQNCGEIPD